MIRIKKFNLDEKIYDSELGTGISSTEYIFEKYYKSKNPEDYFISFTAIDKLGINPRSDYKTPIGIYTYPVKEFFEIYVNSAVGRLDKPANDKIQQQKIGEFAPFAGNNPYVWVVEMDRSAGRFIDDISKTYTERDYDDDVEWFIENADRQILSKTTEITRAEIYYTILNILYKRGIIASIDQGEKEYSKGKAFEYLIDNEEVKHDVLRYMIKNYGNASKFSNSFGGQMWNITRLIAKGNPIKWNKLWRDMGYIGVADRSGSGIIHESEKTQTVFFSVKGFKIVDKIDNIESSTSETIIVNKLRKILESYIISIIDRLQNFNNPKFDMEQLLINRVIQLDEYLLSLNKKQFEVTEKIWEDIFPYHINKLNNGQYKLFEDILTKLQRDKEIKRVVVLYGGRITITYG